jgi:hypothetical protein
MTNHKLFLFNLVFNELAANVDCQVSFKIRKQVKSVLVVDTDRLILAHVFGPVWRECFEFVYEGIIKP